MNYTIEGKIMIGSHYNGRMTGSNGQGDVVFYKALMDGRGESDKRGKGECLLSILLKKINHLNSNGIVCEESPDDADFIRPTYIIVEDLKMETVRAERLGAKVIQEKTGVNGSGFFSLISDPTGAIVSLWQKIER